MKNNVLAQLNTVQSSITSTLEVCLKSNKVKELNSVLASAKTQTTEAIASVAAHPQKRNLSQTKKSLTVIDNLLGGLIEGLSSRELGVKEFRAACSSLQTNFLPKFAESISTEVDKFKSEAGIIEEESDVELTEDQEAIRQAVIAAGEVSEDEISEDEEDESEHERETRIANRIDAERSNEATQIAGDVERRLTRLRGMRKLLPERMKTPYSVLRLPVVPNFETESAKNPVLLEKLSIPFTEIPLGKSSVPLGLARLKMERYVIFEQQMILLVSKDYINDLLARKTEVRDEENSEEFGEHKARRKELNARLEKAKADVVKAELEFKSTPSQAEEIIRLTEKLAKFNAAVTKSFNSQYTAEEKELVKQLRTLSGRVELAEKNIDKRLAHYRSGNDTKIEQFETDMAELNLNANKLDKERLAIAVKVDKLNRRYAKTADLKKQLEQIDLMDRKLAKAKKAEQVRARLVPDAEQMVARMTLEAARNEEGLKQKRKAVKRSGAPITPEDYARSILAVMNERSGSKYALVTPIAAPNPRNSRNILCFWIMPSSKLSALMKATGGKAKVKEWDFPFENERFERAPDVRKGWLHPSDRGSHLLESLKGKTFKSLPKAEQEKFFNGMSTSDQREFLEFLEFSKNAHHRPEGWKSIYKQARRVPD